MIILNLRSKHIHLSSLNWHWLCSSSGTKTIKLLTCLLRNSELEGTYSIEPFCLGFALTSTLRTTPSSSGKTEVTITNRHSPLNALMSCNMQISPTFTFLLVVCHFCRISKLGKKTLFHTFQNWFVMPWTKWNLVV